MRGRFFGDSAWTGLGLAVNGGSQWLVIAALARFTDPVSLGTYGLANAIATPLFVFSHGGQRTLMVNGADAGAPLTAHLRLRVATGVVAFLAALLAGGVFSESAVLMPMLVGVCVSRFSDTVMDAGLGAFQRRERMGLAGRALVWQGLISCVIFAATLAWTRSAVTSVLAYALTRLATSSWHARKAAISEERAGLTASRNYWQMLRPGLPLAFAAALSLLGASVPRLLLEHLGGLRDLGIFAAVASFELAGTIFVSGAAQVAAPKLANYHRSGDELGFRFWINRLSGLALGVGLSAVAVAAIAGERILGAVFGPAYSAESSAFVVLLAAAAVNYLAIVFTTALSARHLLRVQPYIYLVTLLGGVPAGWWLVSRYLVWGAACTSLVLAAGRLICLLALLRFPFVNPWPEKAVS